MWQGARVMWLSHATHVKTMYNDLKFPLSSQHESWPNVTVQGSNMNYLYWYDKCIGLALVVHFSDMWWPCDDHMTVMWHCTCSAVHARWPSSHQCSSQSFQLQSDPHQSNWGLTSPPPAPVPRWQSAPPQRLGAFESCPEGLLGPCSSHQLQSTYMQLP